MRGVQTRLPLLFDLEENMRQQTFPTLILTEIEDEHCMKPGIARKHLLHSSVQITMATKGHTTNLEVPDNFNLVFDQFLSQVCSG